MAVSNSLPLMLPGHPLYLFPHDYYGGVMYMSVAGSNSVLRVPADTIQQGNIWPGSQRLDSRLVQQKKGKTKKGKPSADSQTFYSQLQGGHEDETTGSVLHPKIAAV